MLCELLAGAAFVPQRPTLAPPDGAWRSLPGAARLAAAGDAVLTAAPRPAGLPLSAWLAFAQTGDRAAYEGPYFARRRALCTLALAECAAGTGRYLPAIAGYVWALCEETAWQLPAHNTYLRDAPQLPLPDPARPVIDLFAAETGALLAMVHALLGRRLDAFAPGLARRLRAEVRRRVLRPYRTRHFWWMADTGAAQDTPVCNWTPWCTRNVLLAAAVLEPARALPFYLQKAAKSLDSFLSAYGADGCCDEGAQYYSHAALTFAGALELMCRMAPGVFEPAWREGKLRNMAEYILHMHAAGPWYLNFADCSPKAGPRGAQEYLFAKRVGSAALAALAAADLVQVLDGEAAAPAPEGPDGINLYEKMQAAFAEQEMRAAAARFAQSPPPPPGDRWYPSVGVLVVRRGGYVLGAKAGCNADSHNHNDTGSVTLYKNGRPLLIDVGVGTYTRDTFGPRRYTIWTMQSGWHNLPEFDPDGAAYQQLPGPEARAGDVRVDDDLGGLSLELAAAYGPPGTVPGLAAYRRTVRLAPAGLALHDVTDYPGTVALTLMSAEAPAVQGGAVLFGTLARAETAGAQRITVEAVPVTDARLRAAWPETLYRTRVYFTKELTVKIV